MTFEALDSLLKNYTKDENIQKKTGTLWIDPADEQTKRMIKKYQLSNKNVPFFQDLQSCPEHFIISKQSRFAPVPEHSHSWLEIQYVYSGHCIETINDTPVTVTEGQLLCLDTDVLHSVEAAGENDIIVNILIHQEYCKKYLSNPFAKKDPVTDFFSSLLSDRINHNRYLIIQESPALHFFLRYLMCQYFSPAITSGMICENTISLILAEMTIISEKDSFMGTPLNSDNATQILQYLSSNFRICTLQSVADFFRISPSYLTKLIKKQTGLTYKQLIQQLKLSCAENLLRNTQLPVDVICHEAGYENQSHFYKLFEQKYGCTPNEYRKKDDS